MGIPILVRWHLNIETTTITLHVPWSNLAMPHVHKDVVVLCRHMFIRMWCHNWNFILILPSSKFWCNDCNEIWLLTRYLWCVTCGKYCSNLMPGKILKISLSLNYKWKIEWPCSLILYWKVTLISMVSCQKGPICHAGYPRYIYIVVFSALVIWELWMLIPAFSLWSCDLRVVEVDPCLLLVITMTSHVCQVERGHLVGLMLLLWVLAVPYCVCGIAEMSLLWMTTQHLACTPRWHHTLT